MQQNRETLESGVNEHPWQLDLRKLASGDDSRKEAGEGLGSNADVAFGRPALELSVALATKSDNVFYQDQIEEGFR